MLRNTRAGDARARHELGIWLASRLTKYFRSRGFDDDDANELVQRTIVDILKKFSKAPTDGEAFESWALGFAWREVLTIKSEPSRAFARAAKLQLVGLLRESPARPDAALLERKQLQLIEHHMKRLRPIYRRALEYYLDTGSSRALAVAEGIPDSTARTRTSVAIALLRTSINEARVTRSPFRTPSSAT